MSTHNKTISYVGAVVLVIGAASPTFAQQTGPSCMAEIAQARAKIAGALAGGFPTPADPGGPSSGTGRQLAGGLPTPADPGGPGSGVGRELAAASRTGSSGRSARIQQAQALVDAAQSACDAGDTANAAAKAREAVAILQ